MTRLGSPIAEPAVFVPDEQAWTLWGEDLRARGLVPAESPTSAVALIVPATVPEPLAAAVRDAWALMPPPRRCLALEGTHLPGVPAERLLERHGDHGACAARHEGHGASGDASHMGHQMEGHGEPEGHGHTMEVVGEPSRDGLVMEAVELRLGPLSPALRGGLVADVSLDGDVVAGCVVSATLEIHQPDSAPPLPPDPLAAAAWQVAMLAASERASGLAVPAPTAWLRLLAVEVERALSHLAWLRGFGSLLGWAELVDRAHEAVTPLVGARSGLPVEVTTPDLETTRVDGVLEPLEAARRAAGRVHRLLDGSRRLASRTRGRAAVPSADLRAAGVTGPVTRAAGEPADARVADPRYRALGFKPALREEGDALARTLVRAAEAHASLELALGALRHVKGDGEETGGCAEAPGPTVIEGPRGVLSAERRLGGRPELSAPGAEAQLRLAGEAALGAEWASALVGLASFDLSPWRMPS